MNTQQKPKSSGVHRFSLMAAACLMAGCASIELRNKSDSGESAIGKLYPGLQADLEMTVLGVKNLYDPGPGGVGASFIFLPIFIIDMPFSFALDTVCFPYDFVNRNLTEEIQRYGCRTYWIFIRDAEGRLHGKCPYQLNTDAGIVRGFNRYQHGVLSGNVEAKGDPIPTGRIQGKYSNGKKSNGAFLLHATKTNKIKGPIVYYEDGLQVAVSNVVLRIVR